MSALPLIISSDT